jgi:hypothetical protein
MGGSWGAMAAAQCASDPTISACHEPRPWHLFPLLAVLILFGVSVVLWRIFSRRTALKSGASS